MKAAITELSETRRRLDVEILAPDVDATIDRLAAQYSRRAKVSGFRPGKVPVRIVRQHFKDDILRDVAHELVPRAVDDALREQALTPIETPDVREVSVDDGQPLTFHALFEVMPSIEALDYTALTLRRTPVTLDADGTDRAMEEVRRRASRLEPAADQGVEVGHTVTLDLTRRGVSDPGGGSSTLPEDRHEDVSIELGAAANPPGFDTELIGLQVGESKAFELSYPADHEQTELAGTKVAYEVVVKAIHRRLLPELDDDFARSVGEFGTLEALRTRIASDLQRQAETEADRGVRQDLMTQLAARVTVEVPEGLVSREIGRRLEQIANRLAQQRVDPQTAKIDWDALRDEQRAPSLEMVRGSMVLDEVTRRESLTVGDEDIERELTRYAEQLGRTPAAVRAQLEKEDGIARLSEGLRREKAMDFLLSHATIVTA
ncbi:MAG: trigger factor [Acidobacteria bacterium]|jgi:trigger factor|nr:trigger factor [Acidobacteriota bacterium]HJN43589.1 trigger factor [Vicinamibacterales bacterium]